MSDLDASMSLPEEPTVVEMLDHTLGAYGRMERKLYDARREIARLRGRLAEPTPAATGEKALSMRDTQKVPWGHKLTVHVYVPGDINTAMDISDLIASVDDPRIGFMGVGVDEVQDRPFDQGGT